MDVTIHSPIKQVGQPLCHCPPLADAAISPSLSVSTSTQRLLRRCAPRNDMTGGAVFPMSLRAEAPMSLRGHPKEAAAISPSLSVSTSTRRLLRRCTPRKDILISCLPHTSPCPHTPPPLKNLIAPNQRHHSTRSQDRPVGYGGFSTFYRPG